MKLFEYQAKDLLRTSGIPIPKGAVLASPDDAPSAVEKTGLPVAIKAQVLVGGKGKAGGVVFADTIEKAKEQTKYLMSRRVKGQKVTSVLIEEKVVARNECYAAIAIDQAVARPLIMFSREGGVEIESIVMERPDAIVSKTVTLSRGFSQFDALGMLGEQRLSGPILPKVSDILHKLYWLFMNYDCLLAEINPLSITEKGDVYAVGAVIDIDDNSLCRHSEIEIDMNARYEDEITKEASKRGLSYVRLEGDIGVIGSGAGLTMATIDLIRDMGGRPADFLETGGGITEDLMAGSLELLLRDKRLKAVIVNLYGGINPMPEAARGIVKAWKKSKPTIPILVKLVGNQQEEAWQILEASKLHVVKNIETDRAVEYLLGLVN